MILPMIGPHEGQELELMLAGMKRLSMFHDIVPAEGMIPEDIIPESSFAPHVRQRKILRFSRDVENRKTGDVIRYVCFTLPGDEWRAQFVLWLKYEWLTGRLQHSPSHDELIGRLLGYNDADIAEYLRPSTVIPRICASKS